MHVSNGKHICHQTEHVRIGDDHSTPLFFVMNADVE